MGYDTSRGWSESVIVISTRYGSILLPEFGVSAESMPRTFGSDPRSGSLCEMLPLYTVLEPC